MGSELLPGNSTPWEKAVADTMDPIATLAGSIAAIAGTKIVAPPPSFLPFLIYEYGLGELTPYVENLYDLIDEGIDWQRMRGTPAALSLALGWLGYSGEIVEEATERRFWNLFQLQLDRVRDSVGDLAPIAGVASLSVPKRSIFWRGFHGLDVRPLTYGQSQWGNAHYGEYSGVRTQEGGPLWSFGRAIELTHELVQDEFEAIGVWIEPDWVNLEEPLLWGDFTWASTGATWETNSESARFEAMASSAHAKPAWFCFYDASNQVIGYRKARAKHFVTLGPTGQYQLGNDRLAVSLAIRDLVYLECQTDFGDGLGQHARRVAVVFGGTPADVTRPGSMWLEPGLLVGALPPIASAPVDIVFGESIRDRVKLLLRFDGIPRQPNALVALGDEHNAGVIDFTDNSYAYRVTPLATLLVGADPNSGAYDFVDRSFAQRSTTPAALLLGYEVGGAMDMPSNTYAIRI